MTTGHKVLVTGSKATQVRLPGRVLRACGIFVLTGVFLALGGMDGSVCLKSPASIAFAADESPYGSSEGDYGQKRAVSTKEEARKILKDYFSKKRAKIGSITEKDLYFEAEITDDSGKVIDVVIVDKRTGRIRSIY